MARADVDDVDWMADDVDFVLFSHEVAQLPEYVGLCPMFRKKISHRVELWVARGNVLQARYTHLQNKNTRSPPGRKLAQTGETFENELSSRNMLSSSG